MPQLGYESASRMADVWPQSSHRTTINDGLSDRVIAVLALPHFTHGFASP